jgi:hypothetical protein
VIRSQKFKRGDTVAGAPQRSAVASIADGMCTKRVSPIQRAARPPIFAAALGDPPEGESRHGTRALRHGEGGSAR